MVSGFSPLWNITGCWIWDSRSATFKYSAHYRATGEDDKVNEVVNTGFAYSGITAIILVAATLALAGHANRFFQISPQYQPVFTTLVIMIGCAWALGSIFGLFSGVVEGYQRFDLTSRVWITTMALRTAGLVIVLALGYQLKTMAGVAIGALLAGYVFNYVNLRQVFPALRFSFSKMKMSMFRQMLGYGVHTRR